MNTKEKIENIVNPFLKKWCGNMYGHLVDTDENDGQKLREDIDDLIKEACKEQREICAGIYDRATTDAVLKPSSMTFLYTKIKNAPSPIEGDKIDYCPQIGSAYMQGDKK